MDFTRFKNFKKYLIPNMISMALMAIYTFTDSFVIGQRLGSIPLGAMGICTPVITIAYALGYFFGQGSAALYSINIGKNDLEKSKTIHNTSFFSMILTGILLSIISFIFSKQIAQFLGADNTNIDYVMPYLRVVLIGIPILMIEIFSSCYMNNDGKPKVSMIAAVVGVFLNVALDFLFVYGFKWGMFGAAFATVFCSLMGSLIKVIYVYTSHKSDNLKFSIKYFNIKYLKQILGNGVASLVLQSSSAIVTFVFIFQSIKYYGENGPIIYTVIMNWTLIAVNFMIGVGEASQPLISRSYGKQDREAMGVYLKFGLLTTFIMGVLFVILGYSITRSLVVVFANDSKELVDLIVRCFRLYIPGYLIMGITICSGSYFQAIEKSAKAFIVMLSRGIFFPLILAILMPLAFGKSYLWVATPLAELISLIIAIIFLSISLKKQKVKE